MAWNGAELRSIFQGMDVNGWVACVIMSVTCHPMKQIPRCADGRGERRRSRAVDKTELTAYVRALEGGSEWSEEEIAELFALLTNEHTQISLGDFASATVVPLQYDQLRQAVHAEQLGHLVADCLLSKEDTGFNADGKLKNATQLASQLSVDELEKRVAGVTRQV